MAKAFGDVAKRALRSASGRADSRLALMKAARAACNRLGMDDDDRRARQLRVTGKASMKDMTPAEIGKLLDDLNKDWKSGGDSKRPHKAKIRALWWTLYWIGAVDQPNDDAIDTFVRRMARVDSLQFLDHSKSAVVIEALKGWAEREGVRWPSQAQLDDLLPWHPLLTIAQLERHAVLREIERRLQQRGLIYGSYTDYLRGAAGLSPRHFAWTDRELDAGIRMLGKKLRTAMAQSADE